MSLSPASRIHADASLLILIDWQEKLVAAMDAATLDAATHNAGILLDAARETGLPVLVSEQYPRGLGRTVPFLLNKLSPETTPVSKVSFSCTDDETFLQSLEDLGRQTVVLAGMETHICVWQTARDLRQRGYTVHVVADAVLSRTEPNRRIGLELMRDAGCRITSTETVAFDMIGGADHPAFRTIAKLVR